MKNIHDLATITKVSDRRVVLIDPDEGFRIVVKINHAIGHVSVTAGCGDEYGFDDGGEIAHCSEGEYSFDWYREFGYFIADNFVGDDRVKVCIDYLIGVQSCEK